MEGLGTALSRVGFKGAWDRGGFGPLPPGPTLRRARPQARSSLRQPRTAETGKISMREFYKKGDRERKDRVEWRGVLREARRALLASSNTLRTNLTRWGLREVLGYPAFGTRCTVTEQSASGALL